MSDLMLKPESCSGSRVDKNHWTIHRDMNRKVLVPGKIYMIQLLALVAVCSKGVILQLQVNASEHDELTTEVTSHHITPRNSTKGQEELCHDWDQIDFEHH